MPVYPLHQIVSPRWSSPSFCSLPSLTASHSLASDWAKSLRASGARYSFMYRFAVAREWQFGRGRWEQIEQGKRSVQQFLSPRKRTMNCFAIASWANIGLNYCCRGVPKSSENSFPYWEKFKEAAASGGIPFSENTRSLRPTRALCPFTPKTGVNGTPKARARLRPSG
jgi:hypothetical protein